MEYIKKISYIDDLESNLKAMLEEVYDSIFILTIGEDKDAEERLGKKLGEIACRLSGEGKAASEKILVCSKMFEIMNRSSDRIILKIKAFFEIASSIDEQILCWLGNVQKNCPGSNKYVTALITQVITSSRIKRGEVEEAERGLQLLPENYYGYKELSTYYLFTGNFIKSLNFINKSIKNSPVHLKSYFLRKRREVIFMMEK